MTQDESKASYAPGKQTYKNLMGKSSKRKSMQGDKMKLKRHTSSPATR